MENKEISSDTHTRLLRKPKVLERVPWSAVTLWRHVKEGTFPAPVRLGKNSVAWRERDVEQWIASRKSA